MNGLSILPGHKLLSKEKDNLTDYSFKSVKEIVWTKGSGGYKGQGFLLLRREGEGEWWVGESSRSGMEGGEEM